MSPAKWSPVLRRVLVSTMCVATFVAVGAVQLIADAEQGCPQAPNPGSTAAYYDFVNSFRSACASHENWGRTFGDVRVETIVDGRNVVSVTAATSLAGALASLKVAGKEYLASGGHGAALQFTFHAWSAEAGATECYNPTQAGARIDDRRQPPPFHAPSTSQLHTLSRQDRASLRTSSRPAMFIRVRIS
jgi:hypothetical protein